MMTHTKAQDKGVGDGCGGTYLLSQHSRGRGKLVFEFKASLVVEQQEMKKRDIPYSVTSKKMLGKLSGDGETAWPQAVQVRALNFGQVRW